MNKVFSVVFLGVVVFFSLWLKEPVKADYASCKAACASGSAQTDNTEKCADQYNCTPNVDCDEQQIENCVEILLTACETSCSPDVPKPTPPPQSLPGATPSTPIIPPVVPSAVGETSCPATPTCPDLKSLGVEDKSAFLPDCVYYEGTTSEKCCGCRNVNVLVDLMVKFANWLFGIAGGAALLVFVYGGFVILTAAGGERVKKGKDIIVAAVIGLVIIFTAQVGLKFILSALLTKGHGEVPIQEPATLEGLNIKVIEPK